MSLKAKLEAVIYAAEEPVTLAQLAMLFAGEAQEWKAEREAARAAEEARNTQAAVAETAELPLEPELLQPELLEPEALEIVEPPREEVAAPGQGTTAPEIAAAESVSTMSEPVSAGPEVAPNGEPAAAGAEPAQSGELAGVEPSAPEAAEPDAAAAEAEIRRAARQREREVRAILREILDEIIASYAADNRGVEIREIAGGFRMATKPECHDAVRMFVKSLKPPLKLSLPALETLAVIAYKQPVTAPEVNEVRGVDSSGVFGSLLARKLIATAGRKQVIGRPILYKTTKEFLLRFGLKDLSELPSMEEFEKMATSELEEIGSGEQNPSGGAAAAAAAELDETANEDEARASGANPEVNLEPTPQSDPKLGSETQTSAQSPETQNESNPSEDAPLHAESSAG